MAEGNYPPVGFHFRVEFTLPSEKTPVDKDNISTSEIHFQEVSGLNKEMTTEELIEGGENRFVYRFPKGTKYGNLVLKRALKTNSKIIDWIREAIDNFDFKPATVTVHLLNPDHNTLMTWEFVRCWPVKWSTSDFKSQDNSIVIESLELSYNYYKQKEP